MQWGAFWDDGGVLLTGGGYTAMCSGQIMRQRTSDGVLIMVCKLRVGESKLENFHCVFNILACHFI